MAGNCATGDLKNLYSILVGKRERTKTFGTHKYKFAETKQKICVGELDSAGPG